MATAWIVAVLMIALAVVAAVHLPPLHPGQLWTIPWGVVTGLYALHLLPYRELRIVPATLIVLAGAGFTGAAWLAGKSGTWRRQVDRDASVPQRIWLATVILASLTIFGVGIFIAQVAGTFGVRAALVSSPEVRTAIEGGTMWLTIKYLYIAFAAALMAGMSAARASTRERRAASAAIVPVVALTTYFSTSRSNIFLAVLIGMLAYLISRDRPPKMKQVAVGAAVVVTVGVGALSIGGSIIGKTFAASELSTVDSPFTRYEQLQPFASPYQYATASVAALNELVPVSRPVGGDLGCATVPLICDFGGAAGLGTSGTHPLRPFTSRPLRWNTYTGLDSPLMDGGVWLAIPIVMLLGLFAGRAWAHAITGSVPWVVFYVMIGAAAITSTGQNRFFAYHHVGATLIALATWYVVSKVPERRGTVEAAV